MSVSNMLEKIFLAGVGALALTGEKTKDLLDELVARGALTVERGKVLNEELKHAAQNAAAKPPADAGGSDSAIDIVVLLQHVERLSDEELAQIRSKLREMEAGGEAPFGEG